MLKIWSDEKYLRSAKDARPILMPFFNPNYQEDGPQSGRFNQWLRDAKKIIQFTDLEQADVAVYPQDPTIDVRGFIKFQDISKPKPIFVFFNSDSTQNIPLRPNGILFRTSGHASFKKHYERGLPAWSPDYGQFPVRKWTKNPSIGFCGQDRRPKLRSQVLDILSKSELSTNFIRKSAFWGGWIDAGRKEQHGLSLRKEFKNNMINNDYNVCMRGGGNFSYRLYETMSAGRIPILIETDCILPSCFQREEVKDLFPIIFQNDLDSVANTIYHFHNKHKDDFDTLQNKIREFWVKYLSPTGFFTHICSELEG